MVQLHHVAIIGPGLLGTSIALALKRCGYARTVVGVGRRRATLEAAAARGCYDRLTTEVGEAVVDGALVIVAVPLGGFAGVFDALAATGVACGVTDVGSTKAAVVREARARLRADQPFVGSHPMAGSEHAGPEAADAGLLEGKPCVLTPDAATDPGVLRVAEALWERLGMRLIRMPPEEHDRKVAAISHLPHLMSVLLVGAAARADAWAVASTGFRDATRLASSNPPMRADIVEQNREAVLEAIAALRGDLDALAATVAGSGRDKLLPVLEAAKERRDAWVAAVADRPGPGGDL